METGLDAYRDQINVWMETICEKTFDDSGSLVDPESKKKQPRLTARLKVYRQGGGAFKHHAVDKK